MENTVRKANYLDGIRGVAALSVFFGHFLMVFYSAHYTFDSRASHLHNFEIKYGKSIFSVLSNGHFSVCIFFVLSGFVLSRKYFQTNNYEILVSGAHRRYLRLYIPVATALIISFILLRAGLYFNVPASGITHTGSWLSSMWIIPNSFQRLLSCLEVSTMFGGENTFDTSLWTMSIEFMGSLLVFAFLALTHNAKNRLFALLVLFIFFKITYNRPMSAFVLGISLNYFEQAARVANKNVVNIIAVLLLTIGLLLGSFPCSFDIKNTIFELMSQFFMKCSEWVHIFGAFFLVLAFVLSHPLQRIISNQIFRFLGYISFSLYLLHPLIIGSFSCYLFLHMLQYFGYNLSVFYIFLFTITICLFLSWLMAKYIDNPGIAFSKYVYNRWFKKSKKTVNVASQNV